MWRDQRRCVLFVLCQPGAEAYFRPVMAELRQTGWQVAVNRSPDAVSPAVIVTSTSYTDEERRAGEWARRHKVGWAQLIDSWYDYKRRLDITNGPGLMPDRIWVFDQLARDSAILEGLPADRLWVSGNPAWEKVRALPAAARSSILIVDQPVNSDMGRRLGYDEGDFLQTIRDGLKDVFVDSRDVVFAVHPRRNGTLPDMGFETEISYDASNALRRCGTVIGMFSSLLIDAFLGGRSVVSVQPKAGAADFCVLSNHGFVSRVTAAEQLEDAIKNAKPGPQGFGHRFADSTRRVCDDLVQLAVSAAK